MGRSIYQMINGEGKAPTPLPANFTLELDATGDVVVKCNGETVLWFYERDGSLHCEIPCDVAEPELFAVNPADGMLEVTR